MLTQPAFLLNSAGGPGTYTVDVNFSDTSKAQYLAPGDIITDRLGAGYTVTTWAGFPSDFSNLGNVTVTPVGPDVAPTNSLALGDASVDTPGQVDLAPQMQTGGTIFSASLIEGRTYKYQVSAGWIIGAEANKALVGDRLIDNTGKAFEITAVSGSPGAADFTQPFHAVEVDKIGDGPNAGSAYLYRSTPNCGFYQGETLNQLAEDQIRNRDELLTDLKVASGVGGGAGAGGLPGDEIATISGASGVVTNDDSLILVTESGASSVVLSGVFDEGKILYVKDAFDGATDRTVNSITITPPSGELIDYTASLDIVNQAQSFTIIHSSGNWFIL
jgi:hypothetical protein